MIALIDAERIHHAQILAPGFTSHDEGSYPTEETLRIPGVFGDEAGAAHNPSSGIHGFLEIVSQNQGAGSPNLRSSRSFLKM
jgi:hypothetical protein